mmetsp:Transcript_5676/g.21407  ORF Transcript_5676/g.21407 Transcript_5676/m.21407 type:complete len:562 (+) Transcript_5676:1085-2770(+)
MRVIVRRRTSIEARVLILYNPKYLRDVCSHLLRRGGAAVARLQSHALRLLQPRRLLSVRRRQNFHARQLRRASELQRLQHGTPAGEEVIARTLQRRHVQPGAQGFKLLQGVAASKVLTRVDVTRDCRVQSGGSLVETRGRETHHGVDEDGLGAGDDLGDARVSERLGGYVKKVSGCFPGFQVGESSGADAIAVAAAALSRDGHATAPVERVALDDRRQRHQLSLNLRDQQLRLGDLHVERIYAGDCNPKLGGYVGVVQLAAQHDVIRLSRDRLDAPHLGVELAPGDDGQERPSRFGQRGERRNLLLHEETGVGRQQLGDVEGADVRLPGAEGVVDEHVREARQLCREPFARCDGVSRGEPLLALEPSRVGKVDAAHSAVLQIFDEPVDAGVDVEDTAPWLDPERRHREHHPELMLEVPDDGRDGVLVPARDLLAFLVEGAVDVGHEDGTATAFDDVVQRGDGLIDPESVVNDAILDAVVVHADEHDLISEVGVLHATQRSRGHLSAGSSTDGRFFLGGVDLLRSRGPVRWFPHVSTRLETSIVSYRAWLSRIDARVPSARG